MRNTLSFILGFAVLSTHLCVVAEIYQWRDSEGKLHISDKPPIDEQAETLELTPLNLADELDTPKQKISPVKRMPWEDKKRQQESNKRDAKLLDACENATKQYISLKGGESIRSPHTVLVDKNGKTISRRQQNDIAESLRKKANARGCRIQEKKW